MERKFTDDEIVKALEICSQNIVIRHNGLTYKGIPLRFLFEEAFDLINRKNAEIESLNERERILIYHVAVERERAIKEFAERVKKIVREKSFDAIAMLRIWGEIDNLVKEMTGEDHNGKPKQDS